MGQKTFWRVLLVNVFFVLILQLASLSFFARSSTAFPKEFWWPVEFSIETEDFVYGLGPDSTLSNFTLNIPLPEGTPARLRVTRHGSELAEASVFLSRYPLPFLLAAMGLLFLSLAFCVSQQSRKVSVILKRVQSGERGARFPDQLLGPNHPVSVAFNQMGGRIEELVDELRKSENHRQNLLRELVQDIREPYELLQATFKQIASEPSVYAVAAAQQELDYFETLLYEMLLLAQLHAPGYESPRESVDVKNLAESEVLRINQRRSAKIKATLQKSYNGTTEVSGSLSLLQRLLRNSIENAVYYARSEVQVHLISLEGELEICVRDDGKGYTDEALALFGTRRNARYLEAREAGKAFSGLGSIIVLSIAASHGGSASPGNWYHPSGELGGGEVRILIPSAKNSRRKPSALLAAA